MTHLQIVETWLIGCGILANYIIFIILLDLAFAQLRHRFKIVTLNNLAEASKRLKLEPHVAAFSIGNIAIAIIFAKKHSIEQQEVDGI